MSAPAGPISLTLAEWAGAPAREVVRGALTPAEVRPEDAARWLALAAPGGEASAMLDDVYAQTAREIEARGPACWASARCCHFETTGHRLYVTGLEAAYTLARLDEGTLARLGGGGALEHAWRAGTCAFLAGNLCGAHAIKPLGCRVYFCDRSAQAWQQDLCERMLGRIREAHDRTGAGYLYGEWRGLLAGILRAGTLANGAPTRPDGE
jgi:Fe-S-cluster containining protein